MQRFSEEDMIRLIAYQNLYGPLTLQRFDILFARLGMDVAAPHMKRGKKPKLKDHLFVWSRGARPRRTGQDLLAAVKGIQAAYDHKDKAQAARRSRRRRGPDSKAG